MLVKEKDNEQMNFQMDRWQLAKNSSERKALIIESTKLFAEYGLKGMVFFSFFLYFLAFFFHHLFVISNSMFLVTNFFLSVFLLPRLS